MSLHPPLRWTLPLPCLLVLALALVTPRAVRAQPASRTASLELAVGGYRPEVEGGDFDGFAWSLRGSLRVAPRLALRLGLSSHDRSRTSRDLQGPTRRENLLLDVAIERDWTFGRSALAVSIGPGLRRSVATDAEEFESTTEERTRLNLGLRVAGVLDLTERVYLRPELGVRWYGDETDEEGMLALGWRF